jgi:hypothetical protein
MVDLVVGPTFQQRVVRVPDGWIWEDEVTGVHGIGPTPLDALLDFRQAVKDHIDVLSAQDELTPGLADQLEYLRRRA